jgi:ribonuclease HI
MDTLHVWTDGSCLGNGTSAAVSALAAFYANGDVRNYSSLLQLDKHTNNRAELAAILYVLVTDFEEHNLVIHTDSKYSIDCLTKYHFKWAQSGWLTSKGTAVESLTMIRFMLDIISRRTELGLETDLVYVKAHDKDPGNNAVDLLARKAASNKLEGGRLQLLRKCGIPI